MSAANLGERASGGYARHIGRVGALAVALGVGVLVSPAAAWADDTPPPGADGTMTSDAGPTKAAAAAGSADVPSTIAVPQQESQTAATSIDGSGDAIDRTPPPGTSPSASETTLNGGVIVRSSGGAHTSGDTTTPPAGASSTESGTGPGELEVPTDPNGQSGDASPQAQPPEPEISSKQRVVAQPESTPLPKVVGPGFDDDATPLSRTQRLSSSSSARVEDDPGPASALTNMAAQASLMHATHVDQPAQDPVIATPVHPVLSMAAQLIDSVLAPFVADGGPITPTNSPVLWTVLAWVRRQLEPFLPPRPKAIAVVEELAVDDGIHPPAADPGGHTGLPDDFERTVLVSGLNQPTDFKFLPDGRILIAEKGGAIKVYHDGSVHDEPLITLVTLPTDTDEERGLLGIAVDPHFEDNGYLYVSYTTAQNRDRLARFTVTGDVADPSSELVLLESDQPGNVYHHGGEVQFGSDGKLYWAMGMNTNNPNSQNLSNVHGKILRLNPDGTIPEDNPFVNTPGAVPAIWAYGLRNPFRFGFTPNGKLLAGDVGGSLFEELNVITAGANYGWPLAEGNCDGCSYANPIYTYAHTADDAHAGSITAVMVYTGDTFGDEYQNKVFIADYTLGWIKELTFDSDYTSFISEKMFDDAAGTTVKLAQGPDGNIYQLTIFPGQLSVIAPSGGNRAPSAVITATPGNGLAPLTIDFSSAGSSDPDPNTTLTYAWDFGDGTTSTLANPTRTYTVNGAYNVSLTVSDGEKASQTTKRVVVGSTVPTAHITSPVSESKYNAGDVITFSGTGSDAEDGVLPDSAYKWTIVFQHADHIHPFRSDIVGKTGSITIPRGADNIDTTSYLITLTVTDSSGLSSSDSVLVKPNLVDLTFNSTDPDAVYTIDGIPYRGTHTEKAVVGVERVLGAPSPQYVAGGQLLFGSWSDGQAQSHTIITPGENSAYTITFTPVAAPPAPWHQIDIGQPTAAGYSSYANGVFTVNGAGNDIWGTTDQFHYVYQSFSGDGTIIARVTSQTDTDGWAKSGIIIKESALPGSTYVLLAVTPDHGVTFQYDYNGDGGSAPYTLPDGWLKLERAGDVFKGYTSTNGTDWTLVGQTTLQMDEDVTAGLAVNSHEFSTLLNATTFDHVSVSDSSVPVGLPTPWSGGDVGAPVLAGSSSHAGGVFTVNGGGNDIWGDADQFHFTYQTLESDGEIVARVTGQESTSEWAKSGLMIKQSTTAGAAYALLAVTPGHGVVMQDGFDRSLDGPAVAPAGTWLKLKRVGDTITGFTSVDGVTWAELGTATVDLDGPVLAGLFVTSHDGGQLNTTVFDNVSVVESDQWSSQDVGAPLLAGNTSRSGGTVTVNGGGNDIWGDADQFHFTYQTLESDGEIVARVTGQESTSEWAKSGLMIKQSTTAGAAYALLAVTPGHGVVMQDGFDRSLDGPAVAPAGTWLKLKRVGDTITGFTSVDGVTWAELGTATVDLDGPVLAGLFVTSHDGGQLNTTVFDNVSVVESDQWSSQDVGAPLLAGNTSRSGGTVTVNGGGNDIWGDADQFHFTYQTLESDGEIVARVTGQESTSEWAKSGLMIKQSTTAGAAYALLAVTPGHGVVMQDGFDRSLDGPAVAPAGTWLKLKRVGDTITGFTSVDGVTWAELGTATVDLDGPVLAGLFVTSHDGGQLNTTVFDNVSVTPAASAALNV